LRNATIVGYRNGIIIRNWNGLNMLRRPAEMQPGNDIVHMTSITNSKHYFKSWPYVFLNLSAS